jgi:predicted esterase
VVLRAPWLVIQSTEDNLVDVSQAKEFGAHLTSSGVKAQMYVEPLGDHETVVDSLMNPKDPIGLEMIKFIRP